MKRCTAWSIGFIVQYLLARMAFLGTSIYIKPYTEKKSAQARRRQIICPVHCEKFKTYTMPERDRRQISKGLVWILLSANSQLANSSYLIFVHYRNAQICCVSTAHDKVQKTFGKAFVECYTRQTALGVHRVGKYFFAECFLSGTRQRHCRVLKPTFGKKK